MEELRGRKRAMHLAAFAYANAETARTLALIAEQESAEKRLSRDPYGCCVDLQEFENRGGRVSDLAECVVVDDRVTFTVKGLLWKLRRDCEAVLVRHAALPAEQFVCDASYRALAGEMLSTGASAVHSLRWYLENPGLSMGVMMRTSLIYGHRSYLAYLQRMLPSLGEARTVGAERLCRALDVMISSPNELDADCLTPLMRAAADGAGARVLQSLAAARADLEARDKDGKTSLFLAASFGHAAVVVELGRLRADVNAFAYPGVGNVTPMYIAAEQGHAGVVEALGQLNADVGCPAIDGRTPVYVAASLGHTAVVEKLGLLGADMNFASKWGTPLQIARDKGHSETAAVVERLGGQVAGMAER